MSLSPQNSHPRQHARKQFSRVACLLLCCSGTAMSQKVVPADTALPKYDLQTESKTKGVVEEIKLIPWGAKKEISELIVKVGDDKVRISVCPKPFQDEMGITFNKGEEIAITGSKVKQEGAEVILAREMVRGPDTLMFRDNKGNPVWNERTGK
jgi:hypothetical protein